ncbi:MAG: hypothetical protein IT303_19920 [Dehalococcoidia bacterium]|nr:hypothetical protein [Dehalococcoidia bacterium]
MNEEQSKRLADAADSLVQAAEALDDARELLTDTRFESEQDRDRVAASQNLASRVDNAAKRIQDAIRKGVVAGGATGRPGAYQRYREATLAAREGRALARTISEQDGSASKRTRGEEAIARLETALDVAVMLVFLPVE